MTAVVPAAELIGVSKVYEGAVATVALDAADLTIAPGEFVALAGASGSGKSTLLNMLGLLDTPSSGEVRLGGRAVTKLPDDERAKLRRDFLGFIFQFHYLLPYFSVLENALMPCRLRGGRHEAANRERVSDLLARVGLGDRLRSRPRQLSGGQQQRVAVVRALANDPLLVLADEPTGNLDTKSGRAVFDLMRDLSGATGKAFLMVTHDEAFAREAERVIRICDGRLEGPGNPRCEI
jgi:ABC-type lipoprotein export system ATPase subunit